MRLRATFTKLEHGEPEETKLWQWFRDESLKEFTRVYDMLGISYDSYAGESFYSDKMPAIVETLKEKNLLVESKGAMIVDLEPYGLTPAPILKSDGSTLYITRDLACAKYRKDTYDFYKNIYVVASQQNLHFQQLKRSSSSWVTLGQRISSTFRSGWSAWRMARCRPERAAWYS